MKFSKKSPLSTTLLAVLFVCFNGFLQSHTLIYDEKVNNLNYIIIIRKLIIIIIFQNGTNAVDICNTITFQLGKKIIYDF